MGPRLVYQGDELSEKMARDGPVERIDESFFFSVVERWVCNLDGACDSSGFSTRIKNLAYAVYDAARSSVFPRLARLDNRHHRSRVAGISSLAL